MSKLKLGYLSSHIIFLALSVSTAYAQNDTQEKLNEIVVSGSSEGNGNSDDRTPPKIGETVKSAKKLEKQQAQDVKDLVRYDTGVTVVEAGRFGNSGFAVRGVEENRVAIQIDGLAQAETISSQGFKELFEGYGNFNNTRNSAEIETLKQVTIRKGADSLKSGSGALGGSVIFETKDARDYLTDKNYYASYKRGYNTADNQNLNTLTLAGRYKYFDAIAVLTSRKGHELENFGYKNYNERVQGKTREKADPYRRTLDSKLLKFAFQPTDNHRFSVMADLYKQTSKGHDFSYTLKPNTQFRTYDEEELRHTNDKVERKNFAFTYENFTTTPLWDTLKITYSQQKITTRARTDDYCDGNDKCPTSQNKLGMKYNENNKLVGNDNKLAKYTNTPAQTKTIKEQVPLDPSSTAKYRWQKAQWHVLEQKYPGVKYSKYCEEDETDPSNFCTVELKIPGAPAKKSFEINGKEYDLKSEEVIGDEQTLTTNTSHILSCDAINCNKKTIGGFQRDGTPVDIPFEVFERDGKKYAKTKVMSKDQLSGPVFFMPNKSGYQENLWTQRDLTTKTKQINIDLTKHIEISGTEHDLSYGGLWAESKKEMINISGISARNIKWWAQYPKDCSPSINNPDRYNALCNRKNVYSFLIPVKTKTGALYFIDDFKLNDYLSFGIGYRYDRVKYNPEYIPGVTPKIPDDLVTNLYITDPKFDPSDLTSPENQARREANANANIKKIAQPKKFSASSYSLNTTVDPLDWLRLQAKYSKAFRAPTGDEIYFTFKHPDFSVLPNKDLEQETAKTKELSVTLHNDMGYISTSVFETRYNNFIDLVYKGNKQLQGHSKLRPFNVYQNINRPNAKVTGFEIVSQISLNDLAKILNGFNLSYKYTYQKGRMDGDIPMNAIQPRTAVYGIGYVHSDDKFGLDLYITHAGAKQAKDTYNMYHKEEGKKDSSIKWRSNSYTTIDLLGYIKPIKNLILRAGVYNLTNRKYITWDSARSIRPFGTSNLIDQKSGLGINRFNAPGRNYRLSMQLEF
ncbi:TonB-dependent hemoglobin/transferrin/lactoferrin family receptor [Aggregatibacter actinomycetemcomitans]|uniref:TonB-dependent hemoglobin/transferrin/lactoferrin family receptor n=1 Tax=Aggregatibacter actinomycetemcomitans TaxID=714 RepID=UPI00197C87BE|nr:TonB-dependent hemoglobin/transferrin/lactoferrin family receptor [Aggregatibacter actinomycetemcomitans]MBN6069328.1 TonB-dependent hemoglobin/transferrin/lactoferrin family receptor [Aggregatibacter actinomycetemcomitans]MBN6085258.1 TonB-dependent hemoglobin/transferrin/lactoferrin family receptor [Aggregatibacter actinomycetemcomitans]